MRLDVIDGTDFENMAIACVANQLYCKAPCAWRTCICNCIHVSTWNTWCQTLPWKCKWRHFLWFYWESFTASLNAIQWYKSSVVILDNCNIHHCPEALKLLEDKRNGTLLPPYSPDYNPIGEAFSKVKTERKAIEKEAQVLDTEGIVLSAFSSITIRDCNQWFRKSSIYYWVCTTIIKTIIHVLINNIYIQEYMCVWSWSLYKITRV